MTSHALVNLKRIKRELQTIKDNNDPSRDEILANRVIIAEQAINETIAYMKVKERTK